MQGWGTREIPKQICQPAASSGTIPTCENLGPGKKQYLFGFKDSLDISRKMESDIIWLNITPEVTSASTTSLMKQLLLIVPTICSSRDHLQYQLLPKPLWSLFVQHDAGQCIMEDDAHLEIIPDKTRRPTASSGTIPTCKNPVTRPGIEPGSPWWEASELTAQSPQRQHDIQKGENLANRLLTQAEPTHLTMLKVHVLLRQSHSAVSCCLPTTVINDYVFHVRHHRITALLLPHDVTPAKPRVEVVNLSAASTQGNKECTVPPQPYDNLPLQRKAVSSAPLEEP
ncbi:hypothetical protein PR048_011182 [Dryococelus australis]|uniref:Uncharacterized protein n=1 Tax=Dryococelus australis TaxID=614101 RepID=A0ABQ9HKU4_9NEOP|nr:hypothetical protein PR048_011182 [Dryococelus australis]